jgi:hypothetical protein
VPNKPGADSLLFLPDSARANLADMGNHVDGEMVKSQRGTDLETEATNIKWSRIMGIPDPCGSKVGYQRIVAIYIKYLQSGVGPAKFEVTVNSILAAMQYQKYVNLILCK